MNTNKFFEKIFDKWLIKIFCLAIAIILYVSHQASLVDKKTVIVPLQVEENGIVTHVGNCPSTVSIVVRANPDEMTSIRASDFTASISADYITETGTYELPVVVKLSDSLMQIDPLEIQTKPENISIHVERKVSNFVKVVPSIVGQVAHGYEISNVEINPSFIEITGPESIVQKTEQVSTSRVNVSNAMTNFTVDANYNPLTKLISVDNVGPYKVTISVAPVLTERTYNNVAIQPLKIEDELQLTSSMPVVNLTLYGEMSPLENYELSKNAVYVDLSGITEPGEYKLPVKTGISSAFTVNAISLNEVTVELAYKNVEKPEENLESFYNGEQQ